MKKGRYVVIIILIFFFLAMATFLAFIYSRFSRPAEIGAASYLEIGLSGPLPELDEPDWLTAQVLGRRPLSVHDIWENLRKAKVDGRIRCVLIRMGALGGGWAKAGELRDAILDFRRSGKKVYAYIEEAPEFDKEYLRGDRLRPDHPSSPRLAGRQRPRRLGAFFQGQPGQAGDRGPVRARRGVQDGLQHVHGERVHRGPPRHAGIARAGYLQRLCPHRRRSEENEGGGLPGASSTRGCSRASRRKTPASWTT